MITLKWAIRKEQPNVFLLMAGKQVWASIYYSQLSGLYNVIFLCFMKLSVRESAHSSTMEGAKLKAIDITKQWFKDAGFPDFKVQKEVEEIEEDLVSTVKSDKKKSKSKKKEKAK